MFLYFQEMLPDILLLANVTPATVVPANKVGSRNTEIVIRGIEENPMLRTCIAGMAAA